MNKELIDRVWNHCLPKEFKEEVKRMWSVEVDCATKYKSGLHKHRTDLLYELFGEHLHWQNNLTSDAEGEEMLTVSRKQIDALQGEIFKAIMDAHDADDWQDAAHYILDVMPRSFAALFGSKCLPDDGDELSPVPKPAEPKFKVGDTASYVCSPTLKHKCTVTKVMQNEHSGEWEYNVMFEWGKPGMYLPESDLEPCTEPEKESLNLSQETANCDKEFDNILKGGFREHNKLHIAAMIMASMMQNAKWGDKYSHIATISCAAADALIIEVEKTNNP